MVENFFFKARAGWWGTVRTSLLYWINGCRLHLHLLLHHYGPHV
ncbi:hypothetical protein LINGRAHAP2_LOCUS9744 [Linum grandiflorum]